MTLQGSVTGRFSKKRFFASVADFFGCGEAEVPHVTGVVRNGLVAGRARGSRRWTYSAACLLVRAFQRAA